MAESDDKSVDDPSPTENTWISPKNLCLVVFVVATVLLVGTLVSSKVSDGAEAGEVSPANGTGGDHISSHYMASLQIGNAVVGCEGCFLGSPIVISTDGSTVAAGALHSLKNSNRPGSVQVFRVSPEISGSKSRQ